MSENDYIAEYVKEKKPEIIGTIDFVAWKIGKVVSNTVKVVTEAIKGLSVEDIANYINDQEGEDGQGDEEAQSASDAQ